jgi:hypothetical protein
MAEDNLVLMQHSTKAAASFTHGETSIDSNDDGIITVPAHLTGHAKAHGFSTDVAEEKPAKVLAKGADGAKGGKKADPKTAEETSGDGSGKLADGAKGGK